MRQEYTERPQETWLEVLHEAPGGTCIIHFNEDITDEAGTGLEGEEATTYSAEHYAMETTWRPGLEETVKANRAAWLVAAMETERTGKPKTETDILREAVASLQASEKSLNSTVDALTMAILEGGEN